MNIERVKNTIRMELKGLYNALHSGTLRKDQDIKFRAKDEAYKRCLELLS